MKNFFHLVFGISLLSGTIIGAGIFALPYVFFHGGFLLGTIYLCVSTGAFIAVYMMYADIIMHAKGEHERFVGYTNKYLGRGAGVLAFFMSVFQMFVVLAIYLVLSATFLSILFPSLPYEILVILFWIFGSVAIFIRIPRLALIQFFVTGGIIMVIGAICVVALQSGVRFEGSMMTRSWMYAFLPLAPILFSFAGRPAIATLVAYSRIINHGIAERFIKRAIVWGTIIPAIVYLFFIVGVLMLSSEVSEDAIYGIMHALPPIVLLGVGILGTLSLWSSYFVIGLNIKQILQYDFHLSPALRACAVIILPILAYSLSGQNFLWLVSFAGGIFLALEGIFIIGMWRSARARGELQRWSLVRCGPWLVGIAFLVFFLALLGELGNMFGIIPAL